MQNNTSTKDAEPQAPSLPTSIPAVILAGGQSQRLRLQGLYKWELPFSDQKNILQYIIHKIKRQSSQVLINGPYLEGEDCENKDQFKQYSLPLIRDKLDAFQGPLAGLFTAIRWAKEHQHDWVMTLACDSPFFPDNLLEQLHQKMQSLNKVKNKKQGIIISSKSRLHPIFGLWSTSLLKPLELTLTNAKGENRSLSITRWAKQYAEVLKIETHTKNNNSYDPFFNINTLEDYQIALSIIADSTR